MEPKFLRDYCLHFKEHLERNYPHKDIAEYSRLIDAIDTFIAFGVWPDYEISPIGQALPEFINRWRDHGGSQ
jgi:hypothetical protein